MPRSSADAAPWNIITVIAHVAIFEALETLSDYAVPIKQFAVV
jgi:hypothetical protein